MRATTPKVSWGVAASVLLAAVGAAGCPTRTAVEDGLTGVRVTVRWDQSLVVDQLAFSAMVADVAGASAFASGSLPDPPAALESGEESVVILVADEVAGRAIVVLVDALAGGVIVGTETGTTTLVRGTIADLVLTLEVAACGDGECSAQYGENRCTCMMDCPRVCGDGCCSSPQEDSSSCADDC